MMLDHEGKYRKETQSAAASELSSSLEIESGGVDSRRWGGLEES